MARARWQIFFGTLLLLAVVYRGVGGYTDLAWYLQDAENLWTRGTMALTERQSRDSSGVAYHRFAPGLAVISGPFVLLGSAVHRVAESVSVQTIIVLLIPLAAGLAAVLLFEISVRLGAERRDALWGVLIVVFGSPFLSYTRMYYTEIVIVACLYLAVWAWLRAEEFATLQQEGRILAWWALSGLALGAVMACHYITVMTVAGLVAVWGGAELFGRVRETKLSVRILRVSIFLAPIVLIGVGLLIQNYLRYGTPFTTGYNLDYGARTIFSANAIPENLGVLAQLVERTPWILAALVAGFVLRRRFPVLVWSIVVACVLQQIVWVLFVEFGRFAVRYDLPDLALLGLALPALVAALRSRFPQRGLVYATLALMLWNVFWFLKCDDWCPSFQIMENGRVHGVLWYQAGFYMGMLEWAVFAALLIGGALLFRAAWRTCRNLDAASTASPVP